MDKALGFFKSFLGKLAIAGVLIGIAWIFIPFERNLLLFFKLVVVGIGFALLSMYDKTPNKIFNSKNGRRVLGVIAVLMILGFFFPSFGSMLSPRGKSGDGTADARKMSFPSFNFGGGAGNNDQAIRIIRSLPDCKEVFSLDEKPVVSGLLQLTCVTWVLGPSDRQLSFDAPANKGYWIWFKGDENPLYREPGEHRPYSYKTPPFRVVGEGPFIVKLR